MKIGLNPGLGRSLGKDWLFWSCAAVVLMIMPTLLGVAWATFLADHNLAAAQRAGIYRSYDTRLEIQETLSLLKDAETSQRGYLITGNPEFLQRNLAVARSIDGNFAELERLISDPEQKRRLQVFKAETRAKLAEMDEVIRLRDQLGAEAAERTVGEGRGERLMNRIRAVAGAMAESEKHQLDAVVIRRDLGALKDRRLINATFTAMLLAILGAGVMAFRYTYLRSRLIRRNQSESDRRLAVFNSAMDTIITLNPSGGVESINKAGELMFGYSQAELVGRDISVLAPLAPGDGALFLDRLGELEEGEVREFEGLRKNGETLPIDVSFGRMSQPDGVHVVAVMRDCRERKRVERAKSEFISTVSHELRTPLTSIAGSLGLLTAGAAGALPERAARLVGIAENNSRRLVRLINDILDIEKFHSGMMTFAMAPVDIASLAAKAVEEMSGFAGDRGVRIAFDPPGSAVTVQGDADRLVQVLANLLSNAAKYSPDGEVVALTMSTSAERVRISVRDNGPGIPPDFQHRIFGKFAQSDSSDTRKLGGTGLGLAITKEIVEHHGGRIWFDSPPGEGATFHVELPVLSAEPERLSSDGPRLLLCEDDPDITRVLTSALSLQGFQVAAAGTLAEAEAMLSGPETYLALLLDLKLPDGDGLDLVRRLRNDPATRSLPVIIVSASPRADAASGFEIIDWIEKPVDLSRLRASLETVAGADQEPPIVLHVDDDPDLRRLVEEAFGSRGRLIPADSLASARDVLSRVTPQLVILDVGLPDGSGLDLIPDLVTPDGRALPTVIFSAQSVEAGDLSAAVDAVLTKSRSSLEHLVQVVRLLSRPGGPAPSETPQ